MDDLDPATAASLDDLAACLKHVHLLADKPTFRALEQQTTHANGLLPGTRLKRARLTRTVVSDVLLGRKFPGKAFLLTFVDACGVDLENDRRWEEAWDRLAPQYQQILPLREAEILRQENEELRQRLTAAEQQAEEVEHRIGQAPAQGMKETWLTIVGDLADHPELRFTPAGVAIARFRIASTPGLHDEQSDFWEKDDALFLTVNVWRQAAENVMESLTRGSRAIVTGKLRQRSYETKKGEKRTVYELEADEVSRSLQAQGMKETQLTIAGDLVDDPELRFTPTGTPVARFQIASTPGVHNEQSDSWENDDALLLTCHVWGQLAEDVAEGLRGGTRVIVTGRLRQRSYETKEGEKRTVYEIEADEVGPSLLNSSSSRSGGGEPPF